MSNLIVVFVSYGSYGDINPLLAIAKHMSAHCDVRYVSNEYYREHVEAAGVRFNGAGTVEEQLSCTETAALSGRTMEGLMHQFRVHVGMNISRLSQMLEQMHVDGNKLLVVTHGVLNAAFPVCEKLRIPVVRAHLAPSHLSLNKEDFLLEEVFHGCPEWRARWIRYPRHALRIHLKGAPHAHAEYNNYRSAAGIGASLYPYQQFLSKIFGRTFLRLNVINEILLTPKWFAEPIGPEIGHVHCSGFAFLDQPSMPNQQEVEEFIARYGAPVVFTPGTGIEDMAAFCRPIESVCYKLGAPGILLAKQGREQFRSMQRTLNHPVMHIDFADMQWLLSKAKLLVHTGGIGTTAQAIRAGVSQIVLPLMNDQYRNALRILLNGLGGVVYQGGFVGDNIERLYNDLQSSEVHRENLSHLSQCVRGEDGAANAGNCLLDSIGKMPTDHKSEAGAKRNIAQAVPVYSE